MAIPLLLGLIAGPALGATETTAAILQAPADTAEAPADAAETPADAVPLPPYEDHLAEALAVAPGGLTADEVARRAVVESPAIEARRADLQSTAATVDETLARFSPNVTLQAAYTRLSPADQNFGTEGALVGAANEGPLTVGPCPGGTGSCVLDSAGVPVGAQRLQTIEVPLDNYSLQASLSVPLSDYALRLLPAKQGAESETRAAVLRREAEKVKVQLDARLAYYDWLRARAQVAVAEQSLERMRARLEDTRIGEAAGTLTSADVLRLDGLVANAEASLMQAQSFEQVAARNLAVIMGQRDTSFEVGENVVDAPPPLPLPSTKEALVEEALQRRREVKALRNTLDAVEASRKVAVGAYYPQLNAVAETTYANPNRRFFPQESKWRLSWSVGATLTWRLDAILQGNAEAKKAKANKRQTRANLEQMRNAVELEVVSAWEEYERALATLTLTSRSLVAAEAAYEQQVVLYRAGEVTTTDVIEAEAERINATLRDVNARIDARVADAKLLRAAGRMDPLEVEADRSDQRYEQVGPRLRNRRNPS